MNIARFSIFFFGSLLWACAMSKDLSGPLNETVETVQHKTGHFTTRRNSTIGSNNHGLRFVLIKTDDSEAVCDMDYDGDSFVYLTLDGNRHERCQTEQFNYENEINFRLGRADVFDTTSLGDCGDVDFEEGLFQFNVIYHGSTDPKDYWCPVFVILIFEDDRILECNINEKWGYGETNFRCIA